MADESGPGHGKLCRNKALQKLPDSLRAFFPVKLRESTEKDAADLPDAAIHTPADSLAQQVALPTAAGLQKEELSGEIGEIFGSGQFEKAADVSADERAGHVGALEEMVWEMEESV